MRLVNAAFGERSGAMWFSVFRAVQAICPKLANESLFSDASSVIGSAQVKRALIVVGKAPQAGRAKTRLVPPLSAEDAAELYQAFLLDALELGLSLRWERVALVHPAGAADALRRTVPQGITLLEQSGMGLGDALSVAFRQHFAEGFTQVVLIGSDNPTLSRGPIEAACSALTNDFDLSIGPSTDGGYYLIGMRRAHDGLFEDIEWSTPRVYRQTVERAQALNLRVHPVPEWYDVDEPSDLLRLELDLRSASPDVAAHTRSALARLRVHV
jgi:rSAM/selenodomain-associated transferase 1